MHNLIKCIRDNRLTTLKGIPGIGKTTIARNLGAHLAEREVFQDGIIYISMQGFDQASQLVQIMFQKVVKVKNQSKQQNSKESLLDNRLVMEENILKTLKDCKVLLIIDNLESVLRNDVNDVRNFL